MKKYRTWFNSLISIFGLPSYWRGWGRLLLLGGVGGGLLLTACTSETYDTGDGDLSYLRADFVEMHTAAAKEVDRFVTDEGDTYLLQPHATVAWAEKADTLYRALAYYNRLPDRVEPQTFQTVYVLRPQTNSPNDQTTNLPTDPVGVESAWMSPNGRYINLGLLLKLGSTGDADLRQTIGVVTDSETDDAVVLSFIHDQAGVPEYYTQRIFASIPVTDDMSDKAITLRINTYEGAVDIDF